MLLPALVAMCLGLWSLLAPGVERGRDAQAIAAAAAQAVVDDAASAPVLTSHDEDAAMLAFTAYRESSLRVRVGGDCTPDKTDCRAHGPWQLHGDCGTRSLLDQARCELALLHQGAAECPDHPTAILWGGCHVRDPLTRRDVAELADKRERKTRALLTALVGR
jgi:hypothetical protein